MLVKMCIRDRSMGTYIAQAAAIAAPERITHLALLVPKAHGQTSSVQRILQESGQDISQLSAAAVSYTHLCAIHRLENYAMPSPPVMC